MPETTETQTPTTFTVTASDGRLVRITLEPGQIDKALREMDETNEWIAEQRRVLPASEIRRYAMRYTPCTGMHTLLGATVEVAR